MAAREGFGRRRSRAAESPVVERSPVPRASLAPLLDDAHVGVGSPVRPQLADPEGDVHLGAARGADAAEVSDVLGGPAEALERLRTTRSSGSWPEKAMPSPCLQARGRSTDALLVRPPVRPRPCGCLRFCSLRPTTQLRSCPHALPRPPRWRGLPHATQAVTTSDESLRDSPLDPRHAPAGGRDRRQAPPDHRPAGAARRRRQRAVAARALPRRAGCLRHRDARAVRAHEGLGARRRDASPSTTTTTPLRAGSTSRSSSAAT